MVVAKANQGGSDTPIIIKKYANRRLYDTSSSRYVTLDNLSEMVRQNIQFTVVDAKSGEDITRSVLAQIIFDAESRGDSVLPINFLRQVIALYGDSLQNLLPGYLDMSMDYFTNNQADLREKMKKSLGGLDPLATFEEISRNNMAMFEQAMSMFNPYLPGQKPPGQSNAAAKNADAESPIASGKNPDADKDIDSLRAQLQAMQEQLNRLSNK